MKTAIDTSLLRGMEIGQAFRELSTLGFHHVEVGLAHYFPNEASDEETTALKGSLAESGMNLAALVGIYPVSYADEEIRTEAVRQYGRAIRRTKELGCDTLASELMGDSDQFSESSKAFRKSMTELVPVLEREGVTLCFEAHPGDFTERNKIAVDLIREVGSERLRYLYCASHSFVLGNDVGEMIDYAKGAVGYVHFSDTLRPEKTFFSGRYFPKVQPHQHLTPGAGDVDLAGVVRALKRIGYDGFVTLNPFSMFDSPLRAARDSKAFLDSLLAPG